MHTRIERSAFRKGEYVGYCKGAQRIRRGGLGWQTYALGSSSGTMVCATAPTLDALGDIFDKIAGQADPVIDGIFGDGLGIGD